MPRPLPIEARIERAKASVERAKQQYEEAKNYLLKLKEEQKEADREKIMNAISKSNRSLEEILDFIAGE